jgi:hypothetical protein
MKLKTLAVAALAVTGLTLGVGAADAKTRVHIGVGIGNQCDVYGNCYGGGYDPGYGGYDPGYGYYDSGYPQDDSVYRHHRRHYDNYDEQDYGGLSCGEARRLVRNEGFRHVQAEDCSGRRFSFTGWRHGDEFAIRVSARSGQIISVRPLY